jgi:hypothetical protein
MAGFAVTLEVRWATLLRNVARHSNASSDQSHKANLSSEEQFRTGFVRLQ